MERINFYVDGYNLYHGLKRMRAQDPDWQKIYWLDMVKFFDHFIQKNETLQKVYYFTAPDHNHYREYRQRILFQANEMISGDSFEIINGMFYRKTTTCKICNNRYRIHEEKRTDVNMAIKMLDDCFLDAVDTLVLVSADSDLISPLQLINQRFPHKKTRVYFPPGNKSDALYNYMKSTNQTLIYLKNSKQRFTNSIMPDTVTRDGTSFTIPEKWQTYVPPVPAPAPLPLVINGACPHCNNPIITQPQTTNDPQETQSNSTAPVAPYPDPIEPAYLFTKHFGNAQVVETDHPNMQAFIKELNEVAQSQNKTIKFTPAP